MSKLLIKNCVKIHKVRYFDVVCKLKFALKKLGECLRFKAFLAVALSPDEIKERHRLYI